MDTSPETITMGSVGRRRLILFASSAPFRRRRSKSSRPASAVQNESFFCIRTSNLYQLSSIHSQLKVGPANQRYPLITRSDSSQQKFKTETGNTNGTRNSEMV